MTTLHPMLRVMLAACGLLFAALPIFLPAPVCPARAGMQQAMLANALTQDHCTAALAVGACRLSAMTTTLQG